MSPQEGAAIAVMMKDLAAKQGKIKDTDYTVFTRLKELSQVANSEVRQVKKDNK